MGKGYSFSSLRAPQSTSLHKEFLQRILSKVTPLLKSQVFSVLLPTTTGADTLLKTYLAYKFNEYLPLLNNVFYM